MPVVDDRAKARSAIQRGLLIAAAIPVVVGCLVGLFRLAGYAIVVNPSPSVAVGFYLINYHHLHPKRGVYVVFDPDSWRGAYAYRMGWLKPGASYLKRVYGVAGDRVCVTSQVVSVNGVVLGRVSATDRQGRALPRAIHGCILVPVGKFFPLGDAAPNSYDGRYYGLVGNQQIRGQATPIWVFK